MSLERELETISVQDVLETLCTCRGRDWSTDDGLAFASDLTGLSVGTLWGMMQEMAKEPRVLKDLDVATPLSIQGPVVRVDWYNADEGTCGDYHPDDPEDVNLLRFDVYVANEAGDWVEKEDASYCTQMPANTDTAVLEKALQYIYARYADVLDVDPSASVKKLGEELSWIGPDDFAESEENE